jgi:hypothetical protein
MSRTRRALRYVWLPAILAGSFCLAQPSDHQTTSPHSTSAAQAAQKVPVIDGGAGSCSLELTVTASDNKPVYGATVKVHIAYGFAGLRRLDLEASTNINGKVKFIGLPSRVRRPPLEFQVSKDQLAGMATYNPDTECQAKHDVVLETPKPDSGK